MIVDWNKHLAELQPLIKFWFAHKCEVKDTSGTVLVTRKREAGGVRVAVKRGNENELVCDTAKIPTGLTDEVIREIVRLDNVDENELMLTLDATCDAHDSPPSLHVKYSDTAGQKKILAL